MNVEFGSVVHQRVEALKYVKFGFGAEDSFHSVLYDHQRSNTVLFLGRVQVCSHSC